MLELALGLGVGSLESPERFLDLGGCPLRQSAGGGFAIGGNAPAGTFDHRCLGGAGLA